MPRSSLKRDGLIIRSSALNPKTVDPVSRTLRRYLILSMYFIMADALLKSRHG
jgi:hypothetical protein